MLHTRTYSERHGQWCDPLCCLSPEHFGDKVDDQHNDGDNNKSGPHTELQYIAYEVATGQSEGEEQENKAVKPFERNTFHSFVFLIIIRSALVCLSGIAAPPNEIPVFGTMGFRCFDCAI